MQPKYEQIKTDLGKEKQQSEKKISKQRSIDQERAKQAWNCICQVKQGNKQDEYGRLARNAPADIQTNGLGQTLSFWKAKKNETIYKDVSTWVGNILFPNASKNEFDLLQWIINEASTDDYRRATSEAMAFLSWLKRFAEAEFKDEKNG